MKVKNYINTLVTCSFLIFSASSSSAILSGKVKFEEDRPSGKIEIVVNGKGMQFDQYHYSFKIPDAQFYHVRIKAKGYYSSYQTFSDFELRYSGETTGSNALTIPDIVLTKKKRDRVMFAFGGDVMMGRRFSSPYFDEPILVRSDQKQQDTQSIVQFVKPYMELADYAAVNLETVISVSQPNKRAKKSVNFFSPVETLNALQWAGIDYVSLGNNHIYDYLDEGLASTLKHLESSQLDYSGAGENQFAALQPHREQLNGQRYSMFGFVGWTGNFKPHQAALKDKGGAALGTIENITSVVAAESSQSNHVIVQYHGSLEYSDEPSGMTESRLKAAIDHGADLVIAHHPHVTQGFEIYQNKLIAYSMGNFIFDQYFHSTPHSYILYVWMDGDTFHKAEVVPIYLKGYVPIASTGQQRNTLSKRTQTLTQRRGLNFSHSGGHLVLENRKSGSKRKHTTLTFDTGERTKPLYQFPVVGAIQQVKAEVKSNRYRLGQNQLNGGDFETFSAYLSADRSWLFKNARVSKKQAASGASSVEVNLGQGTKAMLGMKTFRRVYQAGNPMTFVVKVLSSKKAVKAKLLFQRRKNRDKFKRALLENEMKQLDEVIIQPNKSWQTIEIDFNTPRVGYRSYRVVLELEYASEEDTSHSIYVDDVALVEWQPHFNVFGRLPKDKAILGLATYIGLEEPADNSLNVVILN